MELCLIGAMSNIMSPHVVTGAWKHKEVPANPPTRLATRVAARLTARLAARLATRVAARLAARLEARLAGKLTPPPLAVDKSVAQELLKC